MRYIKGERREENPVASLRSGTLGEKDGEGRFLLSPFPQSATMQATE